MLVSSQNGFPHEVHECKAVFPFPSASQKTVRRQSRALFSKPSDQTFAEGGSHPPVSRGGGGLRLVGGWVGGQIKFVCLKSTSNFELP